MFLEKSIWRVHLSNLWCTFAQAIFVFWVYRSRWVDCFGCSMVRFVDSMPSVMRYPPSYDVLLYHNKVSVREKIYHIFQNCRNLPLKISSMNQVMFHVVVLFPSLRIWKWFPKLTGQFLVIRNYAKITNGLFARIIGKNSALTILQYVNFINDKPIGRIKYALT